jgi:hypothetical protein
MGIFTDKACCSAAVEREVAKERRMWERLIFTSADRAGVPTDKLSAGEVLRDITNKLIRLQDQLEQDG